MIEQLVKKFFEGSCTQAEKARIARYMEDHPEEIEEYFSEKEWEEFEAGHKLNDEVSARMWGTIRQATTKPKVRYLKQWVAAAAAVLLFLVVGIKYVYLSKPVTRPVAAVRVGTNNLIIRANNTDTVMQVVLPDGSQVSLMPKSNITYDDSYGNRKRDLKLVGEATFQVAKNKAKPFTVYSNQLSTTALGTKFKVSSIAASGMIKVHLYEGKVVVKRMSNVNEHYFLLPGDRLVFNMATRTATITGKAKAGGHTPVKPGAGTVNSWYMFDNQGLAEVFEQIEDIYNVKIYYSERDIRHIRFIGKIEQNDPISIILKDIAVMNNLSMTQKGDTYFIKKK